MSLVEKGMDVHGGNGIRDDVEMTCTILYITSLYSHQLYRTIITIPVNIFVR